MKVSRPYFSDWLEKEKKFWELGKRLLKPDVERLRWCRLEGGYETLMRKTRGQGQEKFGKGN